MKIGIDARPAIKDSSNLIGYYTFSLIRSLQGLDQVNEYRLFWPDDEFKDLTPERLEIFNSLEKDNDSYWESVHLPNCIIKERIDLVHLTQNGLGFPTVKTCPVVITVHHLLPYFFPELLNKKDLKKILDSFPRIVAEADVIITLSQALKKELQDLLAVPPEKVIVTYPAPEEYYRPLDKREAREWVREYYGFTDYLLYTGGFNRGKNLKRVLIAYYQGQKDFSRPYRFILAGNPGDEWEDLAALARALGIQEQVTFIEYIPPRDLVYLYNAAEAFVFPSFYEGFPLQPVEVMACGVPVLASDIPASREILGSAGILVDPYDTLEIAEGLYQLLENKELARSLAREGLRRACSFSWVKTAADTLGIYQSLSPNS